MINTANFLSLPYMTGYTSTAGNNAGTYGTALSVPYSGNNGYNINLFDNQYVGSGLNSGGGMGSMAAQLLNVILTMFTEMFNGFGNLGGGSFANPPMGPGSGYPGSGMGQFGSALMDSSGFGMPSNGGFFPGMPGASPQDGSGIYPPSGMYPQDSGTGQYYMPNFPMPQQDTSSGQPCPYMPPAGQQDTTPIPQPYPQPQPIPPGNMPYPANHHPPRGHGNKQNNNLIINNINFYNSPNNVPAPAQDTTADQTNPYPPQQTGQQDTTTDQPCPYMPPAGQQDTTPIPQPYPQPQPIPPGNMPYPANHHPPRGQGNKQNNNLIINNINFYNSPPPEQQDVTPTPPPPYNDNPGGNYHGDPHFVGFGGEDYDVMGQEGKTYNILSDKGLQYNAKFGHSDGTLEGTTTIQKAGITSGKDRIVMDLHNTPLLNGATMLANKQYTLDNKGLAQWDGKILNFSNSEYTINLSDDPNDKNALKSDVKIKDGVNPLADGVAPHGLLGQTADGTAGVHKGVNNQNVKKQGGTVIDGTVDQYEVNDLFDTSFKNFNRFTGTGKLVTA